CRAEARTALEIGPFPRRLLGFARLGISPILSPPLVEASSLLTPPRDAFGKRGRIPLALAAIALAGGPGHLPSPISWAFALRGPLGRHVCRGGEPYRIFILIKDIHGRFAIPRFKKIGRFLTVIVQAHHPLIGESWTDTRSNQLVINDHRRAGGTKVASWR